MTKQKKKAAEKPESSSEIAESIAVEALSAIRDEIRGIATNKIKPKGHDRASRIAWLASKASSVSAEQRKAQAVERKTLETLTPALVLTWFRGLTEAERSQLVAEIENISQEGSALA